MGGDDGGDGQRGGDRERDTADTNDAPFDCFETKDDKIFITWSGKTVAVLRGKDAAAFRERVRNASPRERQLLMARLTGNFKRGNERRGTPD